MGIRIRRIMCGIFKVEPLPCGRDSLCKSGARRLGRRAPAPSLMQGGLVSSQAQSCSRPA